MIAGGGWLSFRIAVSVAVAVAGELRGNGWFSPQ